MRKYFFSILCFAMVATTFASCSKPNNEPIVKDPIVIEGKSADEFLVDPLGADESHTKTVNLLDGITGLSDQIGDLINGDYYFTNFLPKLEIVEAKFDKISHQIDATMKAVGTISVQQQTIDLLEANNKRSEFVDKILAQNNDNNRLPTVDTILSKILYLDKHPGEGSVLVGEPLYPKGEEQELSKDDLEQRLCQNLELWHRHPNQAHTKVVEFMETLKDYSTALGNGFPLLYDEVIKTAVSSEEYGYDARANFRLADLDVVMKTVHLSGLYLQRMIYALDNMDEEAWVNHFPFTPYPVSDAQMSSSKAQLNSEKGKLQDTYSKFFNLYKEAKVVIR